MTYCPNCRKDHSGPQSHHEAPCPRCGGHSGHSLCQCGNRYVDYGPRQETDPRKRRAMEETGWALGERRDV